MNLASVVFNYATWVAMFPEMSGVSSDAATGYFGLATMYVRNDGRGPVRDPIMLQNLLYLATAHVARLLSSQTNGFSVTGGTQPPSPLVGRINSAAEGSVNVQAEFNGNQPPQAAWWNQTQYGAMVWKMLAPTRAGPRIVPNPRRRIYNPPWMRPLWGPGIV